MHPYIIITGLVAGFIALLCFGIFWQVSENRDRRAQCVDENHVVIHSKGYGYFCVQGYELK